MCRFLSRLPGSGHPDQGSGSAEEALLALEVFLEGRDIAAAHRPSLLCLWHPNPHGAHQPPSPFAPTQRGPGSHGDQDVLPQHVPHFQAHDLHLCADPLERLSLLCTVQLHRLWKRSLGLSQYHQPRVCIHAPPVLLLLLVLCPDFYHSGRHSSAEKGRGVFIYDRRPAHRCAGVCIHCRKCWQRHHKPQGPRQCFLP